MKNDRSTFGGRRLTGGGIAMAIVCLLLVAFSAGQKGLAQAPPMAEEVYLNVQVLKGMPVDTFNDTMGMFASALLFDCVGCHVNDINWDTEAFAVATPRIQRARQMVVMMNTINQTYFGGEQRVTCFTCHSGNDLPAESPSLRLQYTELVDEPSPSRFFASIAAPPVETIFERYLEALGGADALASLTTVTATGTYAGFDTLDREVPMELFVRSPNQRTMIAHWGGGDDLVWAYDGSNGWRGQPTAPAPLIQLTGGNLVGARVDAMMWFPTLIPDAFAEWEVGFSDIDGLEVDVVRGSNPGETPINLYFDEAGLLVRQVRWTNTGAGLVPVQTDYSDYREVAGVQMPFHQVVTWTNGRSIIALSEISANVPIDDARFARPEVPGL